MKLIRQFFRYIRDGFKNIWNNLFMSLSSVITLTLTLSLCSLFVLFAHNTSNFTEQVESEIKIFVEFSKEATQEQIAAAIDLMKIARASSRYYSYDKRRRVHGFY